MMQTFVRPSRDLRNHYAELSEMLKDHDHVLITNHGRGESVLINIEDYAKYEEFLQSRGLHGVRMVVGDKASGMVGSIAEVFPEAAHRRCMIWSSELELGRFLR